MSSIHILFRFHKDFDVCVQNLKILRRLNPKTPIHGMYGGFGGLCSLPQSLTSLMDTVFVLPFEDPNYNWLNGDLCVRWWFKEKGREYHFSHLAIVEWDMLYLVPLSLALPDLQAGANYMSLVDTYNGLLKAEWPWIKGHYKWQIDQTIEKLEQQGRRIDIESLTFGIMGGCIMSRAFLDAYAAEIVPGFSNDEVRMAVYSRALNIPLLDNGFFRNKANQLNASIPSFEDGFGLDEVKKVIADGGCVIHPVRRVIEGIECFISVPQA